MVIRSGLPGRVVGVLPLLVFVGDRFLSTAGSSRDDLIGIASAFLLISVVLIFRPGETTLSRNGFATNAGLRSRQVLWADVTAIGIATTLGRHVRVATSDGSNVRLAAPTWFCRRDRAEAEYRQILEFWNRSRDGQMPRPIPSSAEELLPPRPERVWAAVVCACCYAAFPVGLVVALVALRRESPYVRAHARAAINYVIWAALYLGAAAALLAVNDIAGVTAIFFVIVLMMITPLVGAVGAYGGEPPRWPVPYRFLR